MYILYPASLFVLTFKLALPITSSFFQPVLNASITTLLSTLTATLAAAFTITFVLATAVVFSIALTPPLPRLGQARSPNKSTRRPPKQNLSPQLANIIARGEEDTLGPSAAPRTKNRRLPPVKTGRKNAGSFSIPAWQLCLLSNTPPQVDVLFMTWRDHNTFLLPSSMFTY